MKKSSIIVIITVVIAVIIAGVFLLKYNKSPETISNNDNEKFKITINTRNIEKYSDFIYDYFKLTDNYADDMYKVLTAFKESKLGDTLNPKYMENFITFYDFLNNNNAKIKQTADDLKVLIDIDDPQIQTQKFIDILESNYTLNLEIIGKMNENYHPMMDYVRWYCKKLTAEDFNNPLYVVLNDALKKVEEDADLMGFNITEIYKIIHEYKKTEN